MSEKGSFFADKSSRIDNVIRSAQSTDSLRGSVADSNTSQRSLVMGIITREKSLSYVRPWEMLLIQKTAMQATIQKCCHVWSSQITPCRKSQNITGKDGICERGNGESEVERQEETRMRGSDRLRVIERRGMESEVEKEREIWKERQREVEVISLCNTEYSALRYVSHSNSRLVCWFIR